jgi:hypothetical protein
MRAMPSAICSKAGSERRLGCSFSQAASSVPARQTHVVEDAPPGSLERPQRLLGRALALRADSPELDEAGRRVPDCEPEGRGGAGERPGRPGERLVPEEEPREAEDEQRSQDRRADPQQPRPPVAQAAPVAALRVAAGARLADDGHRGVSAAGGWALAPAGLRCSLALAGGGRRGFPSGWAATVFACEQLFDPMRPAVVSSSGHEADPHRLPRLRGPIRGD